MTKLDVEAFGQLVNKSAFHQLIGLTLHGHKLRSSCWRDHRKIRCVHCAIDSRSDEVAPSRA